MTKQKLINWLLDQEVLTIRNEKLFKEKLNLVIQQAITEHEAAKWKKYPENIPTEGIECAVIIDEDGIEPEIWVYRGDMNKNIWDKFIKKFYELPSSYKPIEP